MKKYIAFLAALSIFAGAAGAQEAAGNAQPEADAVSAKTEKPANAKGKPKAGRAERKHAHKGKGAASMNCPYCGREIALEKPAGFAAGKGASAGGEDSAATPPPPPQGGFFPEKPFAEGSKECKRVQADGNRRAPRNPHARGAFPPPPPEIMMLENSEKFISDLESQTAATDEFASVRMEILLKKFDKDGDGKLSESERKAAKDEISKRRADFDKRENRFVKNMMVKFDKDGDGKLSESEFKAFVVYQRKASAEARKRFAARFSAESKPRMPVEFFKALGLDVKSLNFRQRHIVHDAIKKIYIDTLQTADANSNGKLDKKEIQSVVESPEFKAKMAELMKEVERAKDVQ